MAVTFPAPAGAATFFAADLTPEQVRPKNGAASPAGVSTASGTARFTLDFGTGDPTLHYRIDLVGLSFLSDVTAVHFHRGHAPAPTPQDVGSSDILAAHGAPGEINGPHLLNVFGLPREDDADLFVSPDGTWLSGIWDDGDGNDGDDGERDAGDSVALGLALENLIFGDIYIQLHTRQFNVPDTGELRGQVLLIPEPGVALLLVLGGLLGGLTRRR